MSTLAIDLRKQCRRYAVSYAGASFFCFIFQWIYESFSHEVYSPFMVYAFLIPLVGGMMAFLSFRTHRPGASAFFRQFLNGSVIWLTLGSIFQGVLEIYGTTNELILVFWILGSMQLLVGVLILILGRK